MRLREQFLEILLQEEIELLVSEAVERSERVRAGEHAERLAQRFPSIELSPDSIADEITAAAAYAGIPVEKSPRLVVG
jgi:predicted Holliday junction resolvase-like endonuclease